MFTPALMKIFQNVSSSYSLVTLQETQKDTNL